MGADRVLVQFGKEEEGIPGRGMYKEVESHDQFKSGDIHQLPSNMASWRKMKELVRAAKPRSQAGKKILAGLGG